MIPIFPLFKKLEFSDKTDVERHVHVFPIYSDFDFASMWSWNVKENMEISEHNGNLIVKFIDYLSGEPFFTVLGNKAIDETVRDVLVLSEERGYGNALHLMPHSVVKELTTDAFAIEESREHFDYVLQLDRYHTYSGNALKSRRNFLNSFRKKYPGCVARVLDLKDSEVQSQLRSLYTDWQNQKGFLSLSESFAYERFLEASHALEHIAIGLLQESSIIAFHISALPPGDHANGLFEKADTNYPGVYQALMHEVAKELILRGKPFLNYEQDLGIEGLRRAKMSFDPVTFQKKYRVLLK